VSQFSWDCGLTIKNWRQAARLANIDTVALKKDAASGTDLIEKIIVLLNAVQNLESGRPVLFVNRTIKTFLDLQETYKTNGSLSYSEVEGRPGRVLTFRGVPVVLNEQITNSETVVS
jgi:hypothetical protein